MTGSWSTELPMSYLHCTKQFLVHYLTTKVICNMASFYAPVSRRLYGPWVCNECLTMFPLNHKQLLNSGNHQDSCTWISKHESKCLPHYTCINFRDCWIAKTCNPFPKLCMLDQVSFSSISSNTVYKLAIYALSYITSGSETWVLFPISMVWR